MTPWSLSSMHPTLASVETARYLIYLANKFIQTLWFKQMDFSPLYLHASATSLDIANSTSCPQLRKPSPRPHARKAAPGWLTKG